MRCHASATSSGNRERRSIARCSDVTFALPPASTIRVTFASAVTVTCVSTPRAAEMVTVSGCGKVAATAWPTAVNWPAGPNAAR